MSAVAAAFRPSLRRRRRGRTEQPDAAADEHRGGEHRPPPPILCRSPHRPRSSSSVVGDGVRPDRPDPVPDRCVRSAVRRRVRPGVRVGHVRERVQERNVVRVHAVADRVRQRPGGPGRSTPSTTRSEMSMMSSDRRRPFGNPASVAADHAEASSRRCEHGAMAMFSRSISLALTSRGLVQRRDARQEDLDQVGPLDARRCPGPSPGRSGPYTALSRCGSSGSWTSGRRCAVVLRLRGVEVVLQRPPGTTTSFTSGHAQARDLDVLAR